MKSLEEIETAIYDHYQWFAREAPGVVVQEEGHLAQLWAVADTYYAKEEQ